MVLWPSNFRLGVDELKYGLRNCGSWKLDTYSLLNDFEILNGRKGDDEIDLKIFI